jgi:hypothetical protein
MNRVLNTVDWFGSLFQAAPGAAGDSGCGMGGRREEDGDEAQEYRLGDWERPVWLEDAERQHQRPG